MRAGRGCASGLRVAVRSAGQGSGRADQIVRLSPSSGRILTELPLYTPAASRRGGPLSEGWRGPPPLVLAGPRVNDCVRPEPRSWARDRWARPRKRTADVRAAGGGAAARRAVLVLAPAQDPAAPAPPLGAGRRAPSASGPNSCQRDDERRGAGAHTADLQPVAGAGGQREPRVLPSAHQRDGAGAQPRCPAQRSALTAGATCSTRQRRRCAVRCWQRCPCTEAFGLRLEFTLLAFLCLQFADGGSWDFSPSIILDKWS
ncbi:uncharacterized protein LOC128563313 [Nycticebus coucang]|uniref:uncharacterized protein LOC128563313 n=1 Tax=Nycticebus coucang TaxID=9470 RepID=UPI00234D474D|nr:uncharacterized protein LOC128563313 [Nycticebus coucang]